MSKQLQVLYRDTDYAVFAVRFKSEQVAYVLTYKAYLTLNFVIILTAITDMAQKNTGPDNR
jgi:hypothetical protein